MLTAFILLQSFWPLWLLSKSWLELSIPLVSKAKKLKLEDLLSVSVEERFITQGEHELLNKLREIRNAYSHYRPLSHPSNLARRSMDMGAPMEAVLKDDALNALKAINALVQRRAVR